MNKRHALLIQGLRVAGLYAMALLVCGMALTPMRSISRNFSEDWYNHLWIAEYAGYHLWLTGTAAEVLNTPQAIGMPILLFYAQKFYVVLGVFSFIFGSAPTLRWAAFLLLLLQFYHIRRAARAAGAPAVLSVLAPVLVTWQVFQATTLYERGDVTEFFATILLTICIVNLYVLAVRTAKRSPDPYGSWTTALYYGLAAATHPLTAVYGGAFVAATGLAILVVTRSMRLLILAIVNIISLSFLLAPWLWVVFRFARASKITESGYNAVVFVTYFANSPASAFFQAFSPASFCTYATPVSGPEALARSNIQLSLPLFVLVAVLLFAWRAFPRTICMTASTSCILLATAYGLFWIALLVYCSPGCSFLFGHAFDVLQFPTRLGAYVNLALLLGALSLLGMVDWHRVEVARLGRWFCRFGAAGLLILCGTGWFSKCFFIELCDVYAGGTDGLEALLRSQHLEARRSGYWVPGASGPDNSHLTDLPPTGYFQSAYDVIAGLRSQKELAPNTPLLSVPFALGKRFGSVLPRELGLSERTLVMTNVNPFPWNELLLDGRPVPRRDLFRVPSLYGVLAANRIQPRAYALFIDRGLHTLSYRFAPEPLWRWLEVLSWSTLAVWVAAGSGVACHRWRQWRLSPPTSFGDNAKCCPIRPKYQHCLTRQSLDCRRSS